MKLKKLQKKFNTKDSPSRFLFTTTPLVVLGLCVVVIFIFFYLGIPKLLPLKYDAASLALSLEDSMETKDVVEERVEDEFIATHVALPSAVKAIYMTACVAGTPSFRADLVHVIETTEINSVIIDIKDYTGSISFEPKSDALRGAWGVGCAARDMREFIATLHEKGIFVIGRITVFQDPYYTSVRPDLAVKKESDTSVVWKDYKGISFIEVGAREYWDYIVTLSKESYALGFDELNFDYIRFPSDGNMRDIYYPFSEEKVIADPDYGKAKVVRSFFAYLHNALKDTDVITSADLFGMVTTNTDDLNIGQVLEYALPYFDYVAPMVYPSHYPKHFNGYENPNHYPYGVVNFSMSQAVKRMKSDTTRARAIGGAPIASTSPQLYTKETFDPLQLRPWLQDFDYGGTYNEKEVREQIQATYDAGLTSWMLWAPSNRYTVGALLPE